MAGKLFNLIATHVWLLAGLTCFATDHPFCAIAALVIAFIMAR